MALIEREALLDIAEQQGHVTVDDILSADTIDAAPVVHGQVLDNGNPICGPCSVCDESVNRRARYCSMCGARMDGGEEHEAD